MKAIAMTAFQKTLVTVAIVVAAATGVVETHRAWTLRTQAEALEQQLTRERDDAHRQLAALRDENERLARNTAELPKWHSEVDRRRRDSEELAALNKDIATDPAGAAANSWLDRARRLKERLNQTPQARIPELEFVTGEDWLWATMRTNLESEADYRNALAELRFRGEIKFAGRIADAVPKYSKANGGQLPTDTSQLIAYLDPPVDNTILQRYEIVRSDSLPTIPTLDPSGWVITQKNAVDLEYDDRIAVGAAGSGSDSFEASVIFDTLAPAINAYASAHDGQVPNDPAQLSPYATTPEQQAALEKLAQRYKDKILSPVALNMYLKKVQRNTTR